MASRINAARGALALASGLALCGALAMPAAAQTQRGMVSAAQPEGLVAVLKGAGYETTLDKDDLGDPLIRFRGEGYRVTMLFYGCDKNTHKGCDSVQFRTAFDREEPWTARAVSDFAAKYRYASASLDDEGDPVFTWDVVTGDGIPAAVFLSSVRRFENTISNAAELVFGK